MTQTKCQHCGADAQLFLCGKCTDTMRDTLRELPWWLARLTETAVGQTRMTDNGGRRSARRDELKGDKTLAACLEQLPDAKTLEQARYRRQQHALAVALASGGCNLRASELLAEIADGLGYWVRVMCESRGIAVPVLPAGRDHGLPLVAWLHKHVKGIAASEDAGDIMGDVLNHRRDIERVVNRPVQWIDLGECPILVNDDDDNGEHECGRKLRAASGQETVRCRDCGTKHDTNWLKLQNMSKPMTWDMLNRAATTAHESYRVNRMTLWRWRNKGRIVPVGVNSKGDPLYSWHDLQRIKDESRKPENRLVTA